MRFAIIGCGRIAERHAYHISKRGTLVAVCDIIEEKAVMLASAYSCKWYSSAEEMLNEISVDVVAICTPNGLHAEHTISSLNSGFHVLCEKPLALSIRDCIAMIKAAQKNNRLLFCVKQNRYNPPVIAVKNLIDENSLGNIFNFHVNCLWHRGDDYYTNSWHGSKELDGGTLFTQFSHFIDLIYWFFGDIKSSSGYIKKYRNDENIQIEDSGAVAVEMQNGITGTINYSVNAFEKNMEGSITIVGEKGTVKIGGEYLNTLEYQRVANSKKIEVGPGNTANNYGSYTGSMSNHDKVYDNLLDALNKNGVPAIPGEEAMKTVEIIENIYRSVQHL